jgi:hypothetical protein
MPSLYRTLANTSLSLLVGALALTTRITTDNAACAEEFQPIKEAEMPKDFPGYTPVGQIEVKQYPAYRKASASGSSGFWTLFSHIKQNKVAMTAPVEMDYGDPRSEKPRRGAMAFLYERPDQGSAGTQGNVTVVDLPAITVVSIGCRGSQTTEAIDKARSKLLEYLTERGGQYNVSGPMRVMGYNSPFVPRDKNFFEVQIPVKPSKE